MLLSWLVLSPAFAAPVSIPVAGAVIAPDGEPINGDHSVTFRLLHADGSLLTAVPSTVSFVGGSFSVHLSLDASVFHEAGLQLSVVIDGGAPSAPAPIGVAPYAANAASLGGIDASGYVRTTDALPWSRLDSATLPAGLANGDDVGVYGAGNGLALSGSTFSVNAGAGLTFSGGALTVNTAVLQPDWSTIQNVPPQVAAGGVTYTAGTGLTLNGTQFSVNTGAIPGCTRTFASCADILRAGCSTGDGSYTLDVDGSGPLASLTAYCDMTTDGGGWTQVVQTLTTDTAGELWRQPWTTNTPGRSHVAGSSYILGDAVRGLLYKSSAFKVELQKVATGDRGHVLYPLDSRTAGFFFATSSALEVPAQVINSDGTRTLWELGLCFSGTYRSLSGANGLVLLGATSVTPNSSPNVDCDWGAWNSQMLLRPAPATNAISTNFGESSFTSYASAGYHLRFSLR